MVFFVTSLTNYYPRLPRLFFRRIGFIRIRLLFVRGDRCSSTAFAIKLLKFWMVEPIQAVTDLFHALP